jgi:diguanylate cyclase (GGDEF)-like protein
MVLDVRTLAILSVAIYVLVAIAMAFLSYGNRDNPGLRGVAVGTMVIAFGLLLVGLRGIGVPPLVSIVLGNGMMALGLAQVVAGLRQYLGRPQGWPGLLLPVVLLVLVQSWFSLVDDNITWRTVAFSMAHVWLSLVFAGEFLRPIPDELWRGPRLLVALSQLCHVGVSLWRGVTAATEGAPADLFGPFWFNAIVYIDGVLVYLAFAIGMILVDGQRLQSRLARLAASDPLTGLANRRGFIDRVAAALPAQSAILLLIDLDHFKAVNDRYGHVAGDAVLVEAGRRFAALLRPQDSIARLGGEEFAWFMPDTTIEAGFALAERLRAGFADRPIMVDGREIDLRISIGVAAAPADGTLWPDLYRVADERLYRAKREGRDRVVASAD